MPDTAEIKAEVLVAAKRAGVEVVFSKRLLWSMHDGKLVLDRAAVDHASRRVTLFVDAINARWPVTAKDRALAALHTSAAALAGKRTLYVHRVLKNADQVIAWAKAQGFRTTLQPGDMHVTVAFSKQPVDWAAAGDHGVSELQLAPANDRSVEQFGEATVLCFSSELLTQRWQQFIDAGASWDWPSYRPHITITYDSGDVDLDKVVPYSGELIFGSEIFSEINEDWADTISERAWDESEHPRDDGDVKFLSLQETNKAWDESEHPRDEHGRWTDAGDSDDFENVEADVSVGSGSEQSKGNCMRAAYDWIKQNRDEGTLVHAYVTSGDKRFPHAWGEMAGMVHEVSNDQHVVLPKADYYAQFAVDPTNADEYHAYTYDEAIRRGPREGTLGPWDIGSETHTIEHNISGSAAPSPTLLEQMKQADIILKNFSESWVAKYWSQLNITPDEFRKLVTAGQEATVALSASSAAGWPVQVDVEFAKGGFHIFYMDVHRGTADIDLIRARPSGAGLGSTLIGNAVQVFRNSDTIKKVTLFANVDVGGYAWARYGFKPSVDGWNSLREDLQKRLDVTGDVGAQHRLNPVLQSKDPRCIWAVADDPAGKQLLMGMGWMGALDLQDKQSMTRFDAYIRARTLH